MRTYGTKRRHQKRQLTSTAGFVYMMCVETQVQTRGFLSWRAPTQGGRQPSTTLQPTALRAAEQVSAGITFMKWLVQKMGGGQKWQKKAFWGFGVWGGFPKNMAKKPQPGLGFLARFRVLVSTFFQLAGWTQVLLKGFGAQTCQIKI